MALLEEMQQVLFSGAALVTHAVCFIFAFDSSSRLLHPVPLCTDLMPY